MHILLGLLGIAVGVVLILKTEWFVQNFGAIAWAEQHLGYSGGTRLMYKLIGLGLIFFSLMAATGLLEGFLINTLGRVFRF